MNPSRTDLLSGNVCNGCLERQPGGKRACASTVDNLSLEDCRHSDCSSSKMRIISSNNFVIQWGVSWGYPGGVPGVSEGIRPHFRGIRNCPPYFGTGFAELSTSKNPTECFKYNINSEKNRENRRVLWKPAEVERKLAAWRTLLEFYRGHVAVLPAPSLHFLPPRPPSSSQNANV